MGKASAYLPMRVLAPIGLMLLAGCTSPVESPPPRTYPTVFRSVRPEGLPPAYTFSATNSAVLAADVNRSVARSGARPAATPVPGRPATPALQPSPPPIPTGPVSAEWKLALTLGQRKASLNGVQLWLSEPAVATKPKKKGEKPRITVSETDQRYTIAPLFYAPTNAYVTAPRPVRVFIDPGHGGEDSGAMYGMRKESAIALDIARRLASLLKRAGYTVKISRNNDSEKLSLEDRPARATAWHADIFVSIHLNSGPSAAHGIETYAIPPVGQLSTEAATRGTVSASDRAAARKAEYGNQHDADNIRLAWCVHRRLVAASGRADRGIRRARFVVLREATMPAVLVEVGFITNPTESNDIASSTGREKIAVGLCRGIMDFAAGHISPAFPAQPIVKQQTQTPATPRPTTPPPASPRSIPQPAGPKAIRPSPGKRPLPPSP